MKDIMVGELNAVVQGLGGKAGIGRIVRTDSDLRAAIREGLPHAAVEELMQAADLSLRELAASLDLSVRSLQRRKRNGRLARYESDRTLAGADCCACRTLSRRSQAGRRIG